MADSKCPWKCPEDWSEWSEWLAAGLDARNRWRLPVLLTGMLLASGRRTVTTWLRAAGVSDDYQDYYYFLTSIGRNSKKIASQLTVLVLRTLPPELKKGQRRGRGRPRAYGLKRIRLAKRAGQPRGWSEIECSVYGSTSTKRYKTFLATYKPAGGIIRVVLIKEEHGWHAFYCTDLNASVREIIEAFSDRAAIEQDFHDVKEVWGTGQQQVRNIWNNLAVYNLNLWTHTMVERWAYCRSHGQLVDRSDSPWDDPDRRPSHANRRKTLRAQIMRDELLTITETWSLPPKIIRLTKRLITLAA